MLIISIANGAGGSLIAQQLLQQGFSVIYWLEAHVISQSRTPKLVSMLESGKKKIINFHLKRWPQLLYIPVFTLHARDR